MSLKTDKEIYNLNRECLKKEINKTMKSISFQYNRQKKAYLYKLFERMDYLNKNEKLREK